MWASGQELEREARDRAEGITRTVNLAAMKARRKRLRGRARRRR